VQVDHLWIGYGIYYIHLPIMDTYMDRIWFSKENSYPYPTNLDTIMDWIWRKHIWLQIA